MSRDWLCRKSPEKGSGSQKSSCSVRGFRNHPENNFQNFSLLVMKEIFPFPYDVSAPWGFRLFLTLRFFLSLLLEETDMVGGFSEEPKPNNHSS
ncbi:hypothetical protein TNCV_2362121 [Trichonephila clavipes]|nr:hypothetical protein TNCV_2362121 [Trichonephila clavipes]